MREKTSAIAFRVNAAELAAIDQAAAEKRQSRAAFLRAAFMRAIAPSRATAIVAESLPAPVRAQVKRASQLPKPKTGSAIAHAPNCNCGMCQLKRGKR